MPSPHKTRAPVHYRVEMPDLHTHLYQVTLTVPEPDALQRLTLPAWIPGSYLIREFAKNLQGLQARQGRRALEVLQTLEHGATAEAVERVGNNARARMAGLNGDGHGLPQAIHSLEEPDELHGDRDAHRADRRARPDKPGRLRPGRRSSMNKEGQIRESR